MFILVGLCILIALVLVILGPVKNKENYLIAGNLTLLLGMIIEMARSYNSPGKVFIIATITVLITYGLAVIVVALIIKRKDMQISRLESIMAGEYAFSIGAKDMLIHEKTGKWEKEVSDIDYDMYKCSECGKEIITNPRTPISEVYVENRFCRNCGSKMRSLY